MNVDLARIYVLVRIQTQLSLLQKFVELRHIA
jgi:hypothetical protein